MPSRPIQHRPQLWLILAAVATTGSAAELAIPSSPCRFLSISAGNNLKGRNIPPKISSSSGYAAFILDRGWPRKSVRVACSPIPPRIPAAAPLPSSHPLSSL